jgi:hypothetical protein
MRMVPSKSFVSQFLVLWVLYAVSLAPLFHLLIPIFYLGTLVVSVRKDGKARTVQ